jgi:hypothetical protein
MCRFTTRTARHFCEGKLAMIPVFLRPKGRHVLRVVPHIWREGSYLRFQQPLNN